MKHYLVYKITNLVNNKIYIGKHETSNLDDGYIGSGKVLKDAITKYGIDKFIKEILYDFQTKEEMDLMEKQIVDVDFLCRPDVYNLTCGRDGSWNHINSKKIYQIKGGINGARVQREKKLGIYSEEARRKGLETRKKNKIGIFNPNRRNSYGMLGKKHSEEAKQKMRLARKKYYADVAQKKEQLIRNEQVKS